MNNMFWLFVKDDVPLVLNKVTGNVQYVVLSTGVPILHL